MTIVSIDQLRQTAAQAAQYDTSDLEGTYLEGVDPTIKDEQGVPAWTPDWWNSRARRARTERDRTRGLHRWLESHRRLAVSTSTAARLEALAGKPFTKRADAEEVIVRLLEIAESR